MILLIFEMNNPITEVDQFPDVHLLKYIDL